jgi:hypothetical protein
LPLTLIRFYQTVTGDDDYVPAIKRAKDNRLKIYLFLFYSEGNTGKNYKKVDEKILIDEESKEKTKAQAQLYL